MRSATSCTFCFRNDRRCAGGGAQVQNRKASSSSSSQRRSGTQDALACSHKTATQALRAAQLWPHRTGQRTPGRIAAMTWQAGQGSMVTRRGSSAWQACA